ncbi:VOC family protein [Nocardia jiangxiensis]|uniref:VOC family protein n=1 Tax=Nocardia jiangxiensis TaxID=282685 RepID=UPI0002F7B57D|nr:VOC family protein [Nocardia jiangxiensis]
MIRWNWAFIDRPADRFDEAAAFWATVTGARLSERRGANGEFATLIAAQGDPCLRMQAVGDSGGAHLDLDVDDLVAATQRAQALGASVVADHGSWALMRSPQGLAFCLTTENGRQVPSPVPSAGGSVSRLDQICLDIGPSGFDEEVRFWSELTGWGLSGTSEPEFTRLAVPDRLPIRILLQRLTQDRAPSAHLDLACSDVEDVAAWHQGLGARRIGEGATWTVMRDPVGGIYCLTDRDPYTGRAKQ